MQENDAKSNSGRGHTGSRLEVLLASAKTGSTSALGRALTACRPRLLRVVRRNGGNRLRPDVSASDVVQDTFVNATKGFGGFRGRYAGEFVSWLCAILSNRLAEIARRTSRPNNGRHRDLVDRAASGFVQLALDEQESPSNIVGNQEYSELIRAALARMSRRDQQVLGLRFEDQLTFAQIGQRLERSEDATRMLFTRAVKRLKRELPRSAEA
jgi:RNA polymerase sigma-70 factor (ECF subfamily)